MSSFRKMGAMATALSTAVLFAQSAAAAPSPMSAAAPPPPATCHVKITQHTVPGPGSGFNFTSLWNGLQGITLNDTQSVTRAAGCGPIYNFLQTPKPGWTLININCVINGGTGNVRIIGANINPAYQAGDNEVRFDSLSPGSTLHCKFKSHNP